WAAAPRRCRPLPSGMRGKEGNERRRAGDQTESPGHTLRRFEDMRDILPTSSILAATRARYDDGRATPHAFQGRKSVNVCQRATRAPTGRQAEGRLRRSQWRRGLTPCLRAHDRKGLQASETASAGVAGRLIAAGSPEGDF